MTPPLLGQGPLYQVWRNKCWLTERERRRVGHMIRAIIFVVLAVI
jgi:hypothetical protein